MAKVHIFRLSKLFPGCGIDVLVDFRIARVGAIYGPFG